MTQHLWQLHFCHSLCDGRFGPPETLCSSLDNITFTLRQPTSLNLVPQCPTFKLFGFLQFSRNLKV